MWPAILHGHVRNDPLREAEVAIYDALNAALSPKWTVYYSRPWLGLTPTGAERDGECDFVIAHPDRGVLMVEVKGGGITYDPLTDSWQSRDRHGIRHRIKDPVHQARSAKHELLKKVQQIRGWPEKFIRFSHGVIFPGVKAPPGDLGADRPKELFCCHEELHKNLTGWVEQRLSQDEHASGPGGSGMLALEKLLAAPISLPMPLGFIIAEDEQTIASLTPRQFQLLNAISSLPRVAAGGGAGTGKTILACEDALRFASSGRRTLLTCRGAKLAEHLKERLQGSSVSVLSFDELCREMARAAGLNIPSGRLSEDASAELLIQATDLNPLLRFDGIFVDEAQDFVSHWWVALDSLLSGSNNTQIHVFFDTNQKLYGQVAAQLKSFQLSPINLCHNMRNTRAIHAAASGHYTGLPIYAEGPAGVSVDLNPCPDADIVRTIQGLIQRLTTHDEIPPTSIAVLAVDEMQARALRKSGIPDGMTLDTITDFKGLERPVVILAATRALADQSELAYVGLSRARTHLILVGEPVVLDWLAPRHAAN